MPERLLIAILLLGTACKEERTRAPAAAPVAPADAAVDPGLTKEEIRRATEILAAEASRQGQPTGPSFRACIELQAASIVTSCMSLGSGAGGEPVDRASFELPPPVDGRGVIHHYGSDSEFDVAASAFQTMEKEYGTFVVPNRGALLIFAGAEQLSAEKKLVVRRHIESLH